MRPMRFVICLVCVLCLAAPTFGQGAEGAPAPSSQTVPAAPRPPLEPVLKHIPDGVLGFVVINNVQGFTGKLDGYVTEIGLAEMVAPIMPAGFLAGIQGALMLGEGFNPDAGFAVVMLDPTAFGVDLLSLMNMPGAAAPDPGAPPPTLPIVVFVPGNSAGQIFPNYEIALAGEYESVMLPMGPMLAGAKGGYLVLSPSKEALDAALGADKSFTTQLSAKEVDVLAGSDLAVYINMRVAGPIYAKMMEAVQSQFEMMAPPPGSAPEGGTVPPVPPMFGPMTSLMPAYIQMYRELLSELQSVTVSLRVAQTGLLIDEVITFDPQGQFAKMNAAYANCPPASLDRIPDLPYVLAVSQNMATGADRAESIDLGLDMIDKFLAGLSIAEETKTKVRQIAGGLCDQINGIQLVVGGAPQGAGVFGLACVLQCNDAEKLKSLLAEEASVAQELLTTLLGGEVADLRLTYESGVATVQDIQVDAISISHPKLDELDDEDLADMTKVLGEGKVRLFVAAADAKTVVVTFGGSEAFLAEAIKAAKGTGPIQGSPATAEVMKFLPPNSYSVMLFNVANLTDVILRGAEVMGQSIPPIKINCPTPIAVGCAVDGSSAQVTAYIPNALVKESIAAVLGMLMGPPPGMEMQPVPPGGDEGF